jgi:hypothetical protein
MRRLQSCVNNWPECHSGEYDPRCCRFPKSCSCLSYDPETIQESELEPAPAPLAILGAPSADNVEDEYRRSRDAAVRTAERARIVAMARARAAQYMSDGWDQLADAVNNFAREIESTRRRRR